MRKETTNLTLDPNIKRQGIKAAKKDGRSLSGLVEILLKQFMKKGKA